MRTPARILGALATALTVAMAAPVTAHADIEDLGDVQNTIAFWRDQGIPLFVLVGHDATATCNEYGQDFTDPYAITCNSTHISVNTGAVNALPPVARVTLMAHEIGHVVINTKGLQYELLHMGKRGGVEVDELVADCLAGVSTRDTKMSHAVLGDSLKSWITTGYDTRRFAFDYGLNGSADSAVGCASMVAHMYTT